MITNTKKAGNYVETDEQYFASQPDPGDDAMVRHPIRVCAKLGHAEAAATEPLRPHPLQAHLGVTFLDDGDVLPELQEDQIVFAGVGLA
ncbi:MAG: hypothetical protein QF921_04505 [Pseudomonadales bacterium]|jgi:hypothetical protein|nr:hypothetical protein [Pseudomonadales bacterium]MDP6970764.1 hypothetical protein [Pseudomonadales bacterium]|tara:strand:+ start:810 stop:1076 length:267 start_codon:yes stop_codon:yes gene_type:complete